jgi:hypothetical protein
MPKAGNFLSLYLFLSLFGSVVTWSTTLQARKVVGSIPDEFTGFLNSPNPSSRTMALGSTQPLTAMSSRDLPGGGGVMGGQPARKADLTAICEPAV